MSSPANSEQHFFGTEKVWKILLKIAPPVMLAQLIQALYNIVDSYYVGRDSAAGLTALSIIFPLQLLITALSVGTGVGINTVMARFYGTKQPREADAVAGIGTVLALVSWLIFAVTAWFIMPAYVRLSPPRRRSLTPPSSTAASSACSASEPFWRASGRKSCRPPAICAPP